MIESSKRKCRGGFTLIEILVVVSIIVILIAILLPALGRAKQQAYATRTTAQIQALSNACDAYFTFFQAYPGPISDATVAANDTSMTGTMNMAIGLLGTTEPASNTTTTTVTLLSGVTPVEGGTATTNLWVDFTVNAGPLDGNIVATPARRQCAAFYSQKTSDYVNTIKATGTSLGTSALPYTYVLVDAFPDAMPILYYRRTPGVDGTNSTIPTYVAGANYATGKCAYYWNTNHMFTGSGVTITTPLGYAYPQNGSLEDGVANYFEGVVAPGYSPGSGAHAIAAQGGFVLMSAGIDRTYGIATGKTSSDDIIVFGGQ